MKKRFLIPIITLVLILAVLFVPIPHSAYDDGGTREYTALTYKLVDWNRLTRDGRYEKTRIYFGKDAMLSIDELWAREEQFVEYTVRGTIVEMNSTYGSQHVIIEPLSSEMEAYSASRISFGADNLDYIGAHVGSIVDVTYTGDIMESFPAQIKAVRWQISEDIRTLEYSGEWLDKATAEKYDTEIFSDIVITEIYKDCFFARPVIPMPYTIKLNGYIGEEWCIGDQIICTYENTYYDDTNHRVECDLLGIEASDFELDPNACYKPVIYLYPEKETEVSVSLTLEGELTCTYPAYKDGWRVTASPDGTLTDAAGQTYNYLYWEGDTTVQFDRSKGFCVKGEDTAAFLEAALAELGLTRREANEFIVFWLPMMQNNPYNVISFATDDYTDAAKLEITPAPDTLIRVFMVWQASDSYVALVAPELTSPERQGFTVVEWGGTEIG